MIYNRRVSVSKYFWDEGMRAMCVTTIVDMDVRERASGASADAPGRRSGNAVGLTLD